MKRSILISLSILGIVFTILNYSCSEESNSSSGKAEFIKIPEYNEKLMGFHITGRSSELCCDCSNSSCSAKKCCTAPSNCTCTCESTFFSSSCTCSPCSSIYSQVSYELWLTSAQYSFWTDLNAILVSDGTATASNAQVELANALNAIGADDFGAFTSSKVNMKSYAVNLSGPTKSAINALLTSGGFTDTL